MWSWYNETSLNAIIDELDEFYKATGLKTNFDKSIIHRVGAIKGTNVKLKTKITL